MTLDTNSIVNAILKSTRACPGSNFSLEGREREREREILLVGLCVGKGLASFVV